MPIVLLLQKSNVASVIINRILSLDFPDSMEEGNISRITIFTRRKWIVFLKQHY